MRIGRQITNQIGAALLEVVMATTVFATVGTALVIAVNEIGKLSLEVHKEVYVSTRLQSILEENSKVPDIREGELKTKPDDRGVVFETTVEPIEIRTAEDFLLPQMFVIKTRGLWMENGTKQELTAETYRYAPMFRQ